MFANEYSFETGVWLNMNLIGTGVLVAVSTIGTILIYRKSTYFFHTLISLCFPGSIQSLLMSISSVCFFVFMDYFISPLQ
jgi:hypothetical protein